jgi:hypothetical protein
METFVIRLWTDPAETDESGPPPLKGAAHRVGTGATIRFRNPDELIEFLVSAAGRAPARPDQGLLEEA